MIKLHKHIKVFYEKPNLQEVRVGRKIINNTYQKIIGVEPFEGFLPSKKKEEHLIQTVGIIFYFDKGKPFHMGYFNSCMSRDLALNLMIETSFREEKLQIVLKWEKFFKRSNYSLEDMRRLVGKHFPGRNFFREFYELVTVKGEDFLEYTDKWGYDNNLNLTKLKVKELNSGVIPPEIDKNCLANYLVLKLSIPYPASQMGVNPFFFWRTVVELNYKYK